MESKLQNRNYTIDRYRGIVVFSMIVFQFMEGFTSLGGGTRISQHSPDAEAIYILPNLALADIVAPMFIFAIGLTYLPSLKRRIERDGKKAAIIHFVKRYLMLIGIGCSLDGVNDILDGKFELLNLTFIIPTALILVSSILMLILKAAKADKVKKPLGKILSWFVVGFGAYGIIVAIVNFVMLVTGATSESFGHWVVLQHIGFAGLVALPFALIEHKHGNIIRLVSAGAILLVFGIFHSGNLSGDMFENNMELIDKVSDGGFSGGFSWGAMLIVYLVFSDIYSKSRTSFMKAVGVFAVPTAAVIALNVISFPEYGTWAGALDAVLPIRKGSVSPAYIIVCIFIAVLAFLIVELFSFYKSSFDPFMWWGKNPILMYLLEFGFVGILNVVGEDYFEKAPVAVAIAIIAAVALILTAIAYICNKKKIIIKL